MLITVLVMTTFFIIVASGAISMSLLQQKQNSAIITRDQALHVAEAGVNYYRWVLYHDHEEYCNKEACLPSPDYGPYGPYSYTDQSGQNIIGHYQLYITPPALNGSTIVKIRSVGWIDGEPTKTREIEVQCGISSWSSYSTLANDFMRFGSGTEVWGRIHSNAGIHFDGLAHNLISSSQLSYDDPDHAGGVEFGVHTELAPSESFIVPDGNNPPLNLPDRPDVFIAGRSFPVANVSFALLNNYAGDMYAKATSSGIVFDPRAAGTADALSVPFWWNCLATTCSQGFHITMKNDNTFDVRGVSTMSAGCNGKSSNSFNTQTVATNYPIPANGIIFVKNNVWVDGVIDGTRATILAFKEPFVGGNADIYLQNDLSYTNYDQTDAIGLIAQNNVSVALNSEDDLKIDAALVAKTGRIGREYYGSCGSCANSCRSTITVKGSLATNTRYGFAYVDGTGYVTRNLEYDNNLTFAPPPHFPTTGEYTFISWKEK